MTAAETVAAALGQATREGRGWRAICPSHDDRSPSLSIIEKNGKLLVCCRAGCTQNEVVAALKDRGLWPKPNAHDGGHTFRRNARLCAVARL
jgi:putative DNA primase/helicase